jgi:hypothetical protein
VEKFLTSHDLRLVACASMLADHAATSLIDWRMRVAPALAAQLGPWSYALHCIGRAAFPLFAFLLVEGFWHTHDRRRYLTRLVVLALVSEFPFDLALMLWEHDMESGVWWRWDHQNVLFTLALGLLAIWALETLRKRVAVGRPVLAWLAAGGTVALCCVTAWLLRSDYSWYGVLAIVAGYAASVRWHLPWLTALAIVAVLLLYGWTEVFGLLACLPCVFYNGQLGTRRGRYGQYLFYPVHLLVLGVLRILFVLPAV